MKRLLLLIATVCMTATVHAETAKRMIIAHRGASGYLPEHTLEAVTLAHAMGAEFIEQDVVLTKDDIPVVMHDIHLDTVTDVAKRFPDRKRDDGRWYALDFTLAEIKQMRVTERFNAKTGQPVYPGRFPLWQSAFQIPTLEEELQLIAGLNKTTGRTAGIYPEIKQPAWHLKQGSDPSQIVLPILAKYGYATKEHLCYLQCFEFSEVKRLRDELGWKGRLIQLMGGGGKRGDDGTDFAHLMSPAGLAEVAQYADGIGPAIGSIVTGKTPAERKLTGLVKDAHAARLKVHPYTVRKDELPKAVTSAEELMSVLFDEAKIDGVFSDFPAIR